MELESTAAVESPVTETPVADAPVTESQTPPPEEGAAPPEVPAYQPNLKFKVHDKEMEFDPWLHGVIKDADTEKKARELYEKAYGLDYVKQDRTRLREELGTIRNERDTVLQQVQSVMALRDKGDLDSFFEKLGIDEDKLLRHALQVVKRRENPEVYNQYQQTRQHAQQVDALSADRAALAEQMAHVQRQAREFELNQVMSRPDVFAAAEQFDARLGQGAFQQEVIRRGLIHWNMTKQDISAEQAVNEVLQIIGFQQNAPQPQTQATPATTAIPASAQQKPTLPNIQGRGTSPVAKTPKSIAELRRLYEQKTAV